MLDELELTLIAGRGGNGGLSFRREKYIPRGGPDGGDGGDGGNVVLVADEGESLLDALQRRKAVKAQNGMNGGPANKHGRRGADAVVRVPPGTVVWAAEVTGEPLGDLTRHGARLVAVRGGSGGRGNARLATSTRRTPRIAEKGMPGERLRVRLELRLLADVGLVGLPNAGKSSLLRAMSSARPKVGSYPFTTLEANVGVVERGYERMVVADIPGLIEGAHEGAGLGDKFLRHVGRTELLAVVVDGTSADAVASVRTVRSELEAYGEGLSDKRWLIVVNKTDLLDPDAAARVEREVKQRGAAVFPVSALTGDGVGGLADALLEHVREIHRAEAEREPEEGVLRPRPVVPLTVRKRAGAFELTGGRAREAALRLGGDSEEARAELARRLQRMGAVTALRKAGVEPGDRVRVAGVELEWPL